MEFSSNRRNAIIRGVISAFISVSVLVLAINFADAVTLSKDQLLEVAQSGRVAAQSVEAQVRRANTQRRQQAARKGWLASNHPAWLDSEAYLQKIQPLLAGIAYSAIASALGVSLPYAADIRSGRRLPHPRHWQTLARLVGLSPDHAKWVNGPVGQSRHN